LTSVTGNWQNTYTTVSNNSAKWNNWSSVSGGYVNTSYLSTNNIRLSGATITGNVSATGIISQAPNHCVLVLSASQNIPAGIATNLNFIRHDDPNFWYVNRSIRPTIAGYYNVGLTVMWSPDYNDIKQMQILKNGAIITVSNLPQFPNNVGGSAYRTLSMQVIAYLNGISDEISVAGYTVTADFIVGASSWYTRLELFKIS
jgi:hypothetical protein